MQLDLAMVADHAVIDAGRADAAVDAAPVGPLDGPAPLVTELVTDNIGSLRDADGDASAWVELYNPTRGVLNLADYGLSRVEGEAGWILPAALLEPLQYRIVFLSAKDRRGDEWHADFEVRGGDTLRVTGVSGGHYSALEVPGLLPGEAYGRPRVPLVTDADGVRYAPVDDSDLWLSPGFDDSSWAGAPAQPVGADAVDAPPVLAPHMDALLAEWRFEPGVGAEVFEETGRHPGTLFGDALISDGVGINGSAALNLPDGSWMSVANPDDLDFAGPFTWSLWFRGMDRDGALISRSPSGSGWNQGSKALFVRSGSLQFDTGWVGNPRTGRTVDDDEWRHVAVTYEPMGDQLRIYIDGARVLDESHDVNRFAETNNHAGGQAISGLHIGGSDRSIVSPYAGLIDETTLWSQVLSDAAIEALATGLRPEGQLRYGERLATGLPLGTPPARIRVALPPLDVVGLSLSGEVDAAAVIWADREPLGRFDGAIETAVAWPTAVIGAEVVPDGAGWLIGVRVDGMRRAPAVLARPTPGGFNAEAL